MLEFRDLGRNDRIRLIEGMQPMEEHFEGLYCKYGARGECEGVNDLDYVRCSILNCENCKIYQLKGYLEEINEERVEEKSRKKIKDSAVPISDALTDTVIMRGDRIVHSNNSYDDSIHDQIADGMPVEDFFGIRRTLRFTSTAEDRRRPPKD